MHLSPQGYAGIAAIAVGLIVIFWPKYEQRKLSWQCIICEWLLNLTSKGTVYENGALWDWTYSWERAHSNAGSLWAKEADPDAVKRAYALLESDPVAGFQMCLDLAERGSTWSMIEVARAYRYGKGTARDLGLADEWYRRAIGAGSWIAARSYAQFLGDQGNFVACEEVLKDGVEKGWTPAFFWLAWYRRHPLRKQKNWREIRSLLEYAAEKGHPAAQFYLAILMSFGRFGFREIRRGSKLRDEFDAKMKQRAKEAAYRQSATT
jgi:TPR repeat protein